MGGRTPFYLSGEGFNNQEGGGDNKKAKGFFYNITIWLGTQCFTPAPTSDAEQRKRGAINNRALSNTLVP